MTVQNALQDLQLQLCSVYDEQEAENIADWVIEYITGWKKMERMMHKQTLLTADQEQQLANYTADLLKHRPVQHVLGEAWFGGMKFLVNENVLIPRPETEELVEWVLENNGNGVSRVLDIGTGSGCIPIFIKKKMPAADVYACDISKAALEVAAINATSNLVDIHFIECDILDKSAAAKLPEVDIIISNPPYIPIRDKFTMHKNVLDFEPHLALFVSEEDPIIFYRAIAEMALSKLSNNGSLYFEIDPAAGDAICKMLTKFGFQSVELKKDLQGNERLICAKQLIRH